MVLRSGERFDIDREEFAGKLEFAQLSRISRGAVDLHPRSVTAFWIAISSAMPALASAVMLLI